MIYSEAFDSMPPLARERILRRLWEVVTGKDQSPAFAHLSASDRAAIFSHCFGNQEKPAVLVGL